MDVSLEECRVIAVRYGLPLQFVIKEFHLMDILGQIASFEVSNSRSLVFKGGTALNKVYIQKTQRFSEDLDFDLVAKDAEESLPAFGRELAKSVRGYTIAEFRRVRDTLQFYCGYENVLGGIDHVRIDISPKKLRVAKPVGFRTAVSEFTHASVSGLRVYSMEDLTARKLNALAGRTEGKDVYDVHSALPLCSAPTLLDAIGCMLKSEGRSGTTEEFILKALSALRKSDPKKLRNLTNPFIPLTYRPKDWEELKNDLLLKLEDISGQLNLKRREV